MTHIKLEEYGDRLIKNLSKKLTKEFDKGFTSTNLKTMRNFYIDECIKSNWSTRQLDREINSFYYERILSTQESDEEEVRNETKKLEPSKNIYE